MRAMVLRSPAPIASAPLALEAVDDPEPGPGEIGIDVDVCGVCRTDLHVCEGDLPPARSAVIPGHQVVGRVRRHGPGAGHFALGARVGVAWLHRSCGACPFCREARENLCLAPVFTGWHAQGGFAEQICVPEAFAYAIPDAFGDEEAAPLLCAGIIGYRALCRSGVRAALAAAPARGEPARLGLYGFGSSAHIAAQIARHWGAEIYVFTRDASARALALELGARFAGGVGEPPPVELDAAINFAPAGEIVPIALQGLRRGGTLACAGIYMTEIPPLDYDRDLFQERVLTSVTANTRQDGRELLAVAAQIPIRPRTTIFPLERANEALLAVARGEIVGSAVLRVSSTR